jgi:hypothetical protein
VYGNNIEDIEKIMADAPMLQQKMKPRHLTMIAVGEHHVQPRAIWSELIFRLQVVLSVLVYSSVLGLPWVLADQLVF